jgi:multicomponent Na+:H+ antiporter subunit D
MLAFSSVSQIGYILVGLSFMSSKGLTAAIIHLFNHGITKGLLFMCAGVIFLRYKASFYKEISGLGRIMPWTSAAFLIGGLSLIGIPGTAGFISKWILVQAALEQGSWLIALAILLSSLIAVLYVWQVTEIMYFGDSSKKGAEISVGPFSYITIWILAGATIFFGLSTSFTLEYSSEAARVLINEFSLTN